MATVTIRNLSPDLVRALKGLAKRHNRSMEQEIRALIERHVGDRASALEQIESAWNRQTRPTEAQEIEAWISEGRK